MNKKSIQETIFEKMYDTFEEMRCKYEELFEKMKWESTKLDNILIKVKDETNVINNTFRQEYLSEINLLIDRVFIVEKFIKENINFLKLENEYDGCQECGYENKKICNKCNGTGKILVIYSSYEYGICHICKGKGYI